MVETDHLPTQEHQLSYYEKLSQENKERLRRLDERFFTLHDVVNDPNTRETEAERKMHLIYEMATEELQKRAKNDWKIRELSLLYEKTNTLTHNVEIVIGDPSTGPTTVIEVHHDVIATLLDENGKIPLTVTDLKEIIGQGVQDDTIQLATLIEILSLIDSPETGAIMVVITDHEENGTRGARAYTETLMSQLSKKHPVSLIALESTQIQSEIDNGAEEIEKTVIANSHRGKCDSEIEQKNIQDPIDTIFFNFIKSLTDTQILAFMQGSNGLGHTTGTATYGNLSLHEEGIEFLTKIDFRTNGLARAADVSATIDENLQNTPEVDEVALHQRALELFKAGKVTLTITDAGIELESNSIFAHPSTFNPEADETVIPGLFSIMRILQKENQVQNITNIRWGDSKKLNSNPLEAVIQGSFNLQTDLEDLLINYQPNNTSQREPSVGLSINKDKEVLTGAVLPRVDDTSVAIAQAMNAHQISVPFMTDIGDHYDKLSKAGFTVYPTIFGVGDPVRLHKIERVTAKERLWFLDELLKLINVTQTTLQMKGVA